MPGRKYTPKRTTIKHRVKRTSVKRKPKRKIRPRAVIRTAPSAPANVHMFKRSYDHPFTVGHADNANGVYMNSDSKYMIVKLHTKFNKLPDYTEFKALFSEYKITSITHKLVPFFSQNQPYAVRDDGSAIQNVPNFEIFSIPVNSSVREDELNLKTGAEIDSYLNQSQRKARRIMPSKTQTFTTLHPKVVGYKGPINKLAGISMMVMEAPTYLNTDPAAMITGGADQTDTTHYGVTLLIRRVDGIAFPVQTGVYEGMGFRMENEVFFKCRKVQ